MGWDVVVEDAGVGFGQRWAGGLRVGDGVGWWRRFWSLRGQVHGGILLPKPEFSRQEPCEGTVFGSPGQSRGGKGGCVIGDAGGVQAGEQAKGEVERANEDAGGEVERAGRDAEVVDEPAGARLQVRD